MPRSRPSPPLSVLVLAIALLSGGPAAMAGPAPGGLDLVFVDRDFGQTPDRLVWQLDRIGPEVPGFQPLVDGQLVLARVSDADTGEALLELREIGDDPEGMPRDRVLGRYPLNTGDPVLLYFLETVTRNMASLAHGNPDYIRNRIREALRDDSTVADGQDGGHVVVLTPFARDPNAARMAGFDQLTLKIDVGADPQAPIRRMSAETGTNGYALRLTEVVR